MTSHKFNTWCSKSIINFSLIRYTLNFFRILANIPFSIHCAEENLFKKNFIQIIFISFFRKYSILVEREMMECWSLGYCVPVTHHRRLHERKSLSGWLLRWLVDHGGSFFFYYYNFLTLTACSHKFVRNSLFLKKYILIRYFALRTENEWTI